MYVHKWELLSIAIIAGLLWAIVPWSPLTTLEGLMAGFYLLIISAGILALVEQAWEAITKKEIPG